MTLILWILAVLIVVYGISMIFRGRVLLGIIVIILGLLVGPGGVSLFT
ncbi:GPGG-motif small membrane protein [Glycomyces sp. NPDC047010]